MNLLTLAVTRRLALSLVSLTLSGAAACHTWHTETDTPKQVLSLQEPSTLRVTRKDGSQVVLKHPMLRGDTLAGTEKTGGTSSGPRVLLADVQDVATRHVNGAQTLLLAAGIVAVPVVVFAIWCDANKSGVGSCWD